MFHFDVKLLTGYLQMFRRIHDDNNRGAGHVTGVHLSPPWLHLTSWHHLLASPRNNPATVGNSNIVPSLWKATILLSICYYCLTLGVYFEINLTSVLQTLLPLLHPHTVIYKSATARTQPNQLSFHHLEFIVKLGSWSISNLNLKCQNSKEDQSWR